MNRQRHFFLADSKIVPDKLGCRYSLLKDGQSFGGAVDREGILTVLLSVATHATGKYEIIDKYDDNKKLGTYFVDQPVWSDEARLATQMDQSKPQHDWRKANFNPVLEDPEAVPYAGFHRGDSWNGWAKPFFEKDVVDQIIEDYITKPDDFEWGSHGYRATWVRDVLIVEIGNLEIVEVYEPEYFTIDGVEHKLWSLFSEYFTWDVM